MSPTFEIPNSSAPFDVWFDARPLAVTMSAFNVEGSKVPPEAFVITVPFGMIPVPEPEAKATGDLRVIWVTFVNETPLYEVTPERVEPETVTAHE